MTQLSGTRSPAAAQAGAGAAMARTSAVIDGVLEVAAGALLVAICLIAIVQVFFRYILNDSLPWPEEAARWAFVWLVFVGMAIGVRRQGHIRIDLVDWMLPAGGRRLMRVVSDVVVAATCVMLAVHGLDLVERASTVSPALELPVRYLFLAIPVGAAVSLLLIALTPREGLPAWSGLLAVALGVALYFAVRYPLAAMAGVHGTATILLTVGLVLIFLGVPMAFALAFGAFAAFAPKNVLILVTIPQNMTGALDSFTLLAIPFFILAAAVMNAGGITERLIELATRLVGHLRGGLGHVNVLTNTMMAGVSGSSMADAASIGKLMVPAMAERGYPRPFSCALTSASAVIANLIPPSLGLIIYGALAQASVGALFVATIVPGLMVASALAAVVAVTSARAGYGGGTPPSTGRERANALVVALPALTLPVLIVGGIRLGVFTATEAGAMAFLYAIICGAIFYRRLTGAGFVAAVREALHDTLAVMLIIAAASPFAWVLASERIPQIIGGALGDIATSPWLLLLLINLLLLFVGLFMEMIAAMVILVPILVPLVVAAGIDPIHFGIVLVVNLLIGALTPPMGMLVFTTARVGGVEVTAVFRAILPFIAALIAVLLLITYVPALSLALTGVLGP